MKILVFDKWVESNVMVHFTPDFRVMAGVSSRGRKDRPYFAQTRGRVRYGTLIYFESTGKTADSAVAAMERKVRSFYRRIGEGIGSNKTGGAA